MDVNRGKTMTLKSKIRYSFLLLGLFLIVNGILSILTNKKTFHVISTVAYKELPSVVENSKMNGIAKDMRSIVYRLHLKSTKNDDVVKLDERFQELYDQYQASKREYLAVPFSNNEEKKYFETVDANFEKWTAVSKKMFEVKTKDFKNDEEFESLLKSEYREEANNYLKSMTEFLDYLSAHSKKEIENLESMNKRNEVILYLALGIGTLFSIVGAFTLAKSTGKQLEDLYVAFKNKYENLYLNCQKGDSLSKENLHRSDSQAAAIEETSAAAQETFKSIEGVAIQTNKLNAETTKNIDFLNDSHKTLNKLDESIKEVGQLNESLNTQLSKNNDDLKSVIELFNQIEVKTNMINEIVFQTKLLSFNASVEAARAGENGKGFSVVANEINELASKSGNSSKEIFEILKVSQETINQLIQSSTTSTNKLVEQFKSSVNNCVSLSEESKLKINHAIESINMTSLFVNEIAHSSNEQVSAISEISDSMQSLQLINKENEMGAIQSAKLLSEIQVSANEIDSSIKFLVYGTN